MELRNPLFVQIKSLFLNTLVVLFCIRQIHSLRTFCETISSCECSNGTHEIDLLPIAMNNGSAGFEDFNLGAGLSFLWNPCYNFVYPDKALADGYCTDVALCLFNKTFYDNIGIQRTATFYDYSQTGNPVIQYIQRTHSDDHPAPWVAYVKLNCDAAMHPGIFKFVSVKENIWEFAYKGKYACPKLKSSLYQLSAGSIILIILFCGLFVYFIIGMSYNKCIKNEQGFHVLPMADFWLSVSRDIKNGFMFTLTCGQEHQTSVKNDKYDTM